MENEQGIKVCISPVLHVEGQSLVKFVADMSDALSFMDIGKNASTQCKQGVCLDGSLAVLAQGPCIQLDAARNGHGVSSIE